MRSKILLLALILFVWAIVPTIGIAQPVYDDTTWQLAARTYAAAVSFPENFPDLVASNRAQYGQNTQWRECTEYLASQLTAGAFSQPSSGYIDSAAAEITNRVDVSGMPDLCDKLADDMRSTALDMLRLATWLSAVSSAASEILGGNTEVWSNTEIYALMIYAWNSCDNLLGSEFTSNLRLLSYRGSAWVVLYYASALGYQGNQFLDLDAPGQRLNIDQIRENVVNELAYFLDVSPDSIALNTRLGADLNLTEDDIYLIALSMAGTFNCNIPDEAIISWRTVNDIITTIASVLGQ